MKDRWMLTRKEDESVKSFIEKRFGSSPEVMCRKYSGNYRKEIHWQLLYIRSTVVILMYVDGTMVICTNKQQ